MSELQVSYDDQLVRWHRCWIRPSLLERIGAAGRKLSGQEADDVLGELIDALAGLDVTEAGQVPARLRKVLGL
jgi:hypothetical protein